MKSEIRRHLMILFICVVISVFVCSCNGPSSMPYSSTSAKSFMVVADVRVRISSFYGDVSVRSGDKDQVEVVTYLRSSKEQDLNGIEVDYIHEGDELAVEAKNPSSLEFVSASFEIVVPPASELIIDTAGNVRISGIVGGIDANAAAGNLEISWSSGEIKGQATSDVFIIGTTGNMILESSHDLEVYDSFGSIHARVAHKITIEGFNGQVNLDGGSGEVVVSGDLEGDNMIDVGVGDVALTLKETPSIRVDLLTSAGQIEVMWPVIGRVNGSRVVGRIGEGDQGTLVVRTGSGDIQLNER
ncbi:MAG: hypothetical protein AMJ88_18170 [Anaerolineae bacterium SM23_ 63]|nr:MAG: hypothetical protein AMJ88_18170 [Anaerolineae bacterium SM23_ 63]